MILIQVLIYLLYHLFFQTKNKLELAYFPNNFRNISSGPRSYPESKPIDNNNKNIKIKTNIIVNSFIFLIATNHTNSSICSFV